MDAVAAVTPTRFPWLDPAKYSFSLGLEAAGAVWVAGQTASAFDQEQGRVDVVAGAAEQAGVAWAKVEAVVAGSGRTLAGSTEVVEYLTADGLAQHDAVAAARPPELGAHPSMVVVESLVRPTAAVEIEVVAGQPEGVHRLPQILPLDDGGKVVAPGDLVAQCRWVLEEAERQLRARGLDPSHVVRTVQQTTPDTRRQYRDTAEARRELLGPRFPASTGILTSRLPHPEVLVAIDVWASTEDKVVVPHATEAYRSLTFSPAVKAGPLVFISGTTAWDPATGDTVGPDDIATQAEFVYDQIAQVCAAANPGGPPAQLVKTVEYVTPTGLARYREVGAVRRAVLAEPHPVSTGVVIAGLLSRSWQIEVEAVAVLPDP